MNIIKEPTETEYVDCIQYPNRYAAVKSGLESSVDKFVATVLTAVGKDISCGTRDLLLSDNSSV